MTKTKKGCSNGNSLIPSTYSLPLSIYSIVLLLYQMDSEYLLLYQPALLLLYHYPFLMVVLLQYHS